MDRMCVRAMFTTLMKNKHWPNLHWPLCLENKPGQPRLWSNLPSLPTKYSHLVVFVTEQNKCWHMVTMKYFVLPIWFCLYTLHLNIINSCNNYYLAYSIQTKHLTRLYPLNSTIEKKHGNFSWCLWTTINNMIPQNTLHFVDVNIVNLPIA